MIPAAARAFFTAEELETSERFIADGHVIRPVEDRAALERIRSWIAERAAAHLGLEKPADAGLFLDSIGGQIDAEGLNGLRLGVIEGINAEPWLRPAYFALARRLLEILAGNELVMQRRIGLSIQLPGDDSSLIPVHADVWSGDSPFEVVLWLPLVDCYRTKAMYLLPPARNAALAARLGAFQGRSPEALFETIEPDVRFIEIPFGQVMAFSQNLMHGNRVNRESEARWSMNCRFKSALSPYADKKLGEFFEPITLRAATRMGLAYRLPDGFDE
jgi:sporadic carbohydrate cluster 2OG-Fe(II) oxygenase